MQSGHIHEFSFQMLYVMDGWVTFEYVGQGRYTIHQGDAVLQTPMIKHCEIAWLHLFDNSDGAH